jgi:hypothetical protein
MALTMVAQELVTVSIDAATTAREVIQSEAAWLDLSPYQDLLATTYISEQGFQSGTPSPSLLFLETSPVREDAAFRAFPLANITGAGGLQVTGPAQAPLRT